MPRFMLDTDTCSYIMKRSHPLVLKRLQAVPVSDVCMSVDHQGGAAVRRRGVPAPGAGRGGPRSLPALRRGSRRLADDAAHPLCRDPRGPEEAGRNDRRQRSLHCRPRTQSRAQVGHEQHRRVRPRERADGRELDASPSSFSFDNRRVAGGRRPSLT